MFGSKGEGTVYISEAKIGQKILKCFTPGMDEFRCYLVFNHPTVKHVLLATWSVDIASEK